MKTVLTALCLLAFLINPAFSLKVDLCPVKLGNTWVYRDTAGYSIIAVAGAHNFFRTIIITKVAQDVHDTSRITFDVSVRDSGWRDYGSGKQNFDTNYSVLSIVKTQDTITAAGVLAHYFRFSVMDTASWDTSWTANTMSYSYSGHFFLQGNSIACLAAQYSGNPFASSRDSSIYVDKIGFVSSGGGGGTHYGSQGAGVTLVRFTEGGSTQAFHDMAQPARTASRATPRGIQKLVLIRGASGLDRAVPFSVFDVRGRRIHSNALPKAGGAFLLEEGTESR
jgi:hypothetical protein